MNFSAYVLQSVNHKRRYYGSCQNLQIRLSRRNQGKVRSTKAYKPYTIIYSEQFNTRSEAYQREKFFKSIDGYNFLKSAGIIYYFF